MSELRELCRRAVKHAPNGISAEAVAERVGMRYSTLLSQLSGHDAHKLGADLLVPIMVATGCRAPIRHMAAELGGVFMELPPVSARNDAVTKGLVASVREFGEFAAQVAESIDDGVIRQEELRRISADGMEAVTAILQVIRRAERFCALKHKEDA